LNYINYKFKLRLVSGDLGEWKSFDQEIDDLVTVEPFNAKNLKIRYAGNIRVVSVDYPSELHQTNAILAVAEFFKNKGMVQEHISYESSIGKRCKSAMNEMEVIIKEHNNKYEREYEKIRNSDIEQGNQV
jgi:hypothetical protein